MNVYDFSVNECRRLEVNENEVPIPFGLLFEEPAAQPQGLIIPIYDEETDLSYVEDSNSRLIPYVEFTEAIGTETHTRVAGEPVDEDKNRFSRFAGTDTVTEVEIEATDTDPGDDMRFVGRLGTETATLVKGEATDTDPGDDRTSLLSRVPLMGTDTCTKVVGESTDKDE